MNSFCNIRTLKVLTWLADKITLETNEYIVLKYFRQLECESIFYKDSSFNARRYLPSQEMFYIV
jgi:hypothetical protein